MANKGMVYLVGAGPGDPDLLTIKAKRCIEKADVILYDQLVHPNTLNLAKQEAIRIHVGKKKGQHSKKQEQINELLCHYATKGHAVVRLKGGDPALFARLGEELKVLHEHHIPYQLIPGVSSTIAAPSLAGIPLTHRQLSRSVAMVTGTLQSGDGIGIQDIPTADTIVIVMGLSHLDHIVTALLEKPSITENTPAAIIQHASLASEKVYTSTVGGLRTLNKTEQIQTPALLVIGEVVRLAEDFAITQPLTGKRVILFRTLAQSQSLTETLSDKGAEVMQMPAIDIQSIEQGHAALTEHCLAQHQYIIFTSPNGVKQCMNALDKQGLDTRAISQEIIAIGPKTAATLKQYGIRADQIASQYVAEGILNCLPQSLEQKRILIPTSLKARPVLAEELEKRGAVVTQIALYKPEPIDSNAELIKDGDILVFTSSSTVQYGYDLEKLKGKQLHLIAIGEITAQALKDAGAIEVQIAKTASEEALVEAIERITP